MDFDFDFADFSHLNDNKFFVGLMMILLNIGGKHIVDEFSDDMSTHEKNVWFRRVVIFAVCFIATKDVLTSILLTLVFIVGSYVFALYTKQEKMANKTKLPKQEAENPAYDKKAEPLFQK